MRIDRAIKRILDEARQRAHTILNEKRELLDKLSGILFEKETLADEEVRGILGLHPGKTRVFV
jgi:ATP-dependent Zn protease